MAIAKKIVKRILEEATRPWIAGLVASASNLPDCRAHQEIQSWARKWYGIDCCSSPSRIWYSWLIDFVTQECIYSASKTIETRILRNSPIGISDLQISCRRSDLNSFLVYLFGFSDNRTIFDVYARTIPQGTCAIDIGANLGMHTLVMAHLTGKSGRVVSFEPSKNIYQRLDENIKLNLFSHVEPVNKGVSSQSGTLHFDPGTDTLNIGKGRISEAGTDSIEVVRLDDFLSEHSLPISMIKIDIEGHELEAIRGATKILKQHEPFLVCEFNPENYTLDEFKENIPFPASIYGIPIDYYGKQELLEGNAGGFADVLVKPKSKEL